MAGSPGRVSSWFVTSSRGDVLQQQSERSQPEYANCQKSARKNVGTGLSRQNYHVQTGCLDSCIHGPAQLLPTPLYSVPLSPSPGFGPLHVLHKPCQVPCTPPPPANKSCPYRSCDRNSARVVRRSAMERMTLASGWAPKTSSDGRVLDKRVAILGSLWKSAGACSRRGFRCLWSPLGRWFGVRDVGLES